MDNGITFQTKKPSVELSVFVDSFWMLKNQLKENKELLLLPDGRVDLIFRKSNPEPFEIILLGLGTTVDKAVFLANEEIFSISFNLLAVEYIFHNTISNIVNFGKKLPSNFWNFHELDIQNFEQFCIKASEKMQSLLPKEIDSRKQKLFDLIYSSKGEMPVNELSENVFWSSRQINRYFNRQFGITLKEYNNILRFRASFEHIKEGKLFPEQNFTDQSHFIREVKKFAGVTPKELSKNKDDRFIQFSTLGTI